ncbi:HNH endonuclease [Natroniella acetigena]|uniref:HNH endonuclease signature motif containing protein n=1 Tax=Natroniella acetigena TaxID=52004 RepID=UPI002009F539|nr:HNH endonuclease signature motif containing protein [Natroniella acetigena]MCK8826394.1 HNH endonuclease [Natroniella acetigena]
MPSKLKTPCNYPRCPKLVEAGQGYCDEHRKKRHKQYDKTQRNKKRAKFYSSARWQKLRDKKIKEYPLCEYCLEDDETTVATEVDHVVPIAEDWGRRFDYENLKSSCHSCHMKKHARDK